MTTSRLAAALRACAAGLYPLEAGAGLLIAHDVFLRRGDFTDRFIRHGISITDGATEMAETDWDAAITGAEGRRTALLRRRTTDSAPHGQPGCRRAGQSPRRPHRSRRPQSRAGDQLLRARLRPASTRSRTMIVS
jgi:hypothetical protein